MFNEKLIKDLNKIYRDDEVIKDICDSWGISIDNFKDCLTDSVNQYDFTKMTWGMTIWENLLDIKTDENKQIEDRRAQIESKWKSSSKSDVKLIQAVCDTWENGSIEVTFVAGVITLTFVSVSGGPRDVDGLTKSVNDIIPCHLPLKIVFKYNNWSQVKAKTWGQLTTKTWKQVMENTL